jgi:hypothetical protein
VDGVNGERSPAWALDAVGMSIERPISGLFILNLSKIFKTIQTRFQGEDCKEEIFKPDDEFGAVQR